MRSPYRAAAPRRPELRPLEPEEEMRLILDASAAPRGVRRWIYPAICVALVAWTVVSPASGWGALLHLGPLFFGAVYLGWRHRRHLRRLRAAGYEIPEPLVPEPLVREPTMETCERGARVRLETDSQLAEEEEAHAQVEPRSPLRHS